MTTLGSYTALGQSIWYDNIRRAAIDSGELAGLIAAGVRGITSNPTIFEQAIAKGDEYDATIARLAAAGHDDQAIYEALALEDIGRAADMLRPLYDATAGGDGYVSLEVRPSLAHNTAGTLAEARRLHAALGRPNVMIKVPATPAGLPAISALIAEGISVNVTLIFSLRQYEAVAMAYLTGLEQRASTGAELGQVASVASFFVSRVDALLDKQLAQRGAEDVQGQAAIANSLAAYRRFEALFSGPRWEALASQGARPQRPLWASTGTKNPAYPDTLYVDRLVLPNTVNTVPPATLAAVRDHGSAAPASATALAEAQTLIDRLATYDIDLEHVGEQLQAEGVSAFARSFEQLIGAIAAKRGSTLRLGMVGMGKMGLNMATRLLGGGHRVVAHDLSAPALEAARTAGAEAADSLAALVAALPAPRIIWVMVPAGAPTEQTIESLAGLLAPGDTLIDGGNSNYKDTQRRAAALAAQGINLVDVGTSGGIWGLREGYSLMVGGTDDAVAGLRPILETLAPTKEIGWGRVGPAGAGHFVKMVHNGIEYGLMQAYAEGFELMRRKEEFAIEVAAVAEIWRYGSVVRSWLLDLVARALQENPNLEGIAAYVPDSGEGRWTVAEAVDLGVSIPVITLALQNRFRSRTNEPYSDRLLAALRNQFGGHAVKAAEEA